MKNLRPFFASLTCTIALTAVFFVNIASAQDVISEQPAQGAQMNYTETLPQAVTTPAATESAAASPQKVAKKTPQIIVPENATARQAKKIAKVNQMLVKAAEQPANGQGKELNKVQKATAQMTLKKLSRKLDKMGVEETNEIKAIKEASAAKAVSNLVLIGVILLALGLILYLLPGANTIGLVLLIVGVVLLILGIAGS